MIDAAIVKPATDTDEELGGQLGTDHGPELNREAEAEFMPPPPNSELSEATLFSKPAEVAPETSKELVTDDAKKSLELDPEIAAKAVVDHKIGSGKPVTPFTTAVWESFRGNPENPNSSYTVFTRIPELYASEGFPKGAGPVLGNLIWNSLGYVPAAAGSLIEGAGRCLREAGEARCTNIDLTSARGWGNALLGAGEYVVGGAAQIVGEILKFGGNTWCNLMLNA